MKKKIFAIIDGNAIVHRGYHALPPMTTKDGTMVNAVYGFTSMLLKVMNELKPDYLAVSFDVAGKTFRDEIYEDYKATRVKADQELYDQIPIVYDVVKAFNIPIFTKKGFEADDVIGTVSRLVQDVRTKKKGDETIETIVVTGDMDILQLVDKNTKVYALRKGFSDIVMYDAEKVKERYGFGPEMVVDYKALKGDTSDNIPGVSGIGDKTAKELIEKVGGIDKIYSTISDQGSVIRKEFRESVIKKLEKGKKDAKMSEKLATIDRDVKGINFELKDCVMRDFDIAAVSDLLRKLEFFSLLKRVPGAGSSEQRTENKKVGLKSKSKLTIVTEENFDEFLKEMKSVKEFACKEILSGKDVLTSKLEGLVFVCENRDYYIKLELRTVNSELQKLFQDEKVILVGHDLKQLIKALQLQGVEVKNKLFDVMIASYLINSSTRSHDLKEIVMRELGKDVPKGSDQASLFGADPGIMAQELSLLFEIKKKFSKELKSEADIGLFEKMEMKLIPVLAEMELNGVSVDTKILNELSKDAAETIKKLTKKIWKEAGTEFNIASSVQLREILFEKLELPTQDIKKGKTGHSTAASELEKLRDIHPIIPLIEEYREVEKLRNTYIDVLPNLINEKTGRIHTSFNQAVTTTGRLSSSDPNLQNIPIRTDLGRKVRETFVAEKGYALVVADYSQIELRIVASMAKDKTMMEIFKHGEDIHQATAAIINGVPLEKVTKQMRSAAKAVNFGVLYGMGAYGLAWRTGIARFEAKDFIKKYFEKFSGVKKYLDKTLEFAKDEGYVETLFGRRRYIPELTSDNFQLRSAGERMAINMPIQGTAADLMKLAMIAVYERLESCKLKARKLYANKANDMRIFANKDIKMILQVHDELVLEVKKGLEEKIAKLVKEEMEGVVKLNVPVEVHVATGHSWGKIK